MPLTHDSEQAAPDPTLLALLEALAATSGISVDIVSGRSRKNLDRWLGHLAVSLWAEHGFWHRAAGSERWISAVAVAPRSMQRVRPILDHFTLSTPGSHLETKSSSMAWHYRRAQREFGVRQAHELRMLLGDALSNQPFEVIEGKKVLEVRLRGVNKAIVAQRIPSEPGQPIVMAIGDDRTDEDLFRELPASSVTIAVGARQSCARYRLQDHRDVRRLLRSILEARSSGAALSADAAATRDAC